MAGFPTPLLYDTPAQAQGRTH